MHHDSNPQKQHFNKTMKVVILCNGDFPSAAQPLDALHQAEHIVCCDGAYDTLLANKPEIHTPLTVIGDLDSIDKRTAARMPHGVNFIHVSEQLSNDQTKAFRHVVETFPGASVSIIGATGKREDHTIGNVSLLADYLDEGRATNTTVRMLTDHGIFTPVERKTEFESFGRQQVSLFAMSPMCKITTKGLEYPLDNEPLNRWWQGTLNASLGATFTIDVKNGIVIVYQTHIPK